MLSLIPNLYHLQNPSHIEAIQLPKHSILSFTSTSATANSSQSVQKLTPRKKNSKSVRFSTELCKVRTFDKTLCPRSVGGMLPLTIQAPTLLHLQHRIYSQKVCLSDIKLDSFCSGINGKVRVLNIGFQKSVFIRFTYNNWETSNDVSATYFKSDNLSNGEIDIFSYCIPIPKDLSKSDNKSTKHILQFAIQYQVNGESYWDSNQGSNFSILVCPSYQQNLVGLDTITYLPSLYSEASSKYSQPAISQTSSNSSLVKQDSSLSPPTLSHLIVTSKSNSPFSSRYSFDNSLKASGQAPFCKSIPINIPSSNACKSRDDEKLSCSPVDYSQRFGWGSSPYLSYLHS